MFGEGYEEGIGLDEADIGLEEGLVYGLEG